MELLKALSLLMLAIGTCSPESTNESKKPLPTLTRTELKVARSLNPDDMQTLNVMTRDGSVAQLLVKRRDPKRKSLSANVQNPPEDEIQYTRSFYTNWIPVSSVYLQPNLIRLDTIAKVKNASDDFSQPFNNKLGNVIDSDRITSATPKPVTIRSDEIYIKEQHNTKRGRSVMQLDTDGIPIIQGVRVPDDESDRKVWRNARVINGELVPYEKGYKPPAAIPIGQLVYEDQTSKKSIGPFTTSDNFGVPSGKSQASMGPFTVRDNQPATGPETTSSDYVHFTRTDDGIGPFTKADNTRITNSKLIDYIKEINAQESKRDYFSARKYRSYENSPQIQRRMLQYAGNPSYPNSLLYTPNTKLSHLNFNEGVRTPILQYAHPELGVQPAKASPEDETPPQTDDSKYNDVNRSPYEADRGSTSDLDSRNAQYYTDVGYYKKDVINYPYGNYYMKRKTEQPFWMRITESIKDNVQSGFERMHQLTSPVFGPLVEATHKISHNLGLAPAPVQEKIGFVAPIGTSVILPALGLVAGGAALGLGAAAVGRFLHPGDMRALNGMHYPNDILVIMEEPPNDRSTVQNERLKRSIQFEENYAQQLASSEKENALQQLSAPHLWSDTTCAKRLFCEVMLKQHVDEVVFMEKKMGSLMANVHPDVVSTVAHHLEDVMNAVKTRDCARFICTKRLTIPAA